MASTEDKSDVSSEVELRSEGPDVETDHDTEESVDPQPESKERDSHDSHSEMCSHTTICLQCYLENHSRNDQKNRFRHFDEDEPAIYYSQCFYCLLEGKEKLSCDWDSYEELIRQVMDGFHIGYRDGRYGKDKVAFGKCDVPELILLYKEGYQAGCNARRLA